MRRKPGAGPCVCLKVQDDASRQPLLVSAAKPYVVMYRKELTELIGLLKVCLMGDEPPAQPPTAQDVQAYINALAKSDVMYHMVANLHKLHFETRKEVVAVFSFFCKYRPSSNDGSSANGSTHGAGGMPSRNGLVSASAQDIHASVKSMTDTPGLEYVRSNAHLLEKLCACVSLLILLLHLHLLPLIANVASLALSVAVYVLEGKCNPALWLPVNQALCTTAVEYVDLSTVFLDYLQCSSAILPFTTIQHIQPPSFRYTLHGNIPITNRCRLGVVEVLKPCRRLQCTFYCMSVHPLSHADA